MGNTIAKRTNLVLVTAIAAFLVAFTVAVPHAWAEVGHVNVVVGTFNPSTKVVKSTSYAIVKSDGYLHGTNKAHTADYGRLWGTTRKQATAALDKVTTLYIDSNVRSLDVVKASYKFGSQTKSETVSFQGGLRFGPCALKRVEFLLKNGKNSCTSLGGTYRFYKQKNLASPVNLKHTKVISIPNGCFYGCSNMGTVTLPATTKSIGAYAFQACKKLWLLDAPASVKTIGKAGGPGAFDQCTGLRYVNLRSKTRVALNGNAFTRTGNNFKVYVPRSVLRSYTAKSSSNPWSKYRLTDKICAM